MKQASLFAFSLLLLLPFFSCKKGNSESSSGQPAADTTSANTALEITKVVGIGKVEPEIDIVTLQSQVNGIIQKINFRESQSVPRGAVLFELDSNTESGKIDKIKAQVSEQEASIESIKVDIEKAKLNAAALKRTFERIQNAYQNNAETRQNIDNAESAWKLAEVDIRRLESQIVAAKAKIAELNTDLKLAQIELNKRKIIAETNGALLSLDVSIGSTITSATKLGEFAPESPVNVVTEVDELFCNKIQLGQQAYILQQGSTDTLATGKVIELAPNLKQKGLFSDEIGKLEDRRVREVRVRVDAPGAKNLLLGARVDCVIKVQ